MKLKKSTLVIITILAVLALLTGVLAYLNAPKDVTAGLTVLKQGEPLGAFTLAEIKALGSVTVEKEIVSASHSNDSGAFTGVPLRALLAAADPAWQEGASTVSARAADGYVCAYTVQEVAADDSFLVVYERDGKPLREKTQGGTGPLRLIIQSDPFGNRSAKYLYQIEVN